MFHARRLLPILKACLVPALAAALAACATAPEVAAPEPEPVMEMPAAPEPEYDPGPAERPTVRLSPRVRVKPRVEETLPTTTLQPLMFRPRVLDPQAIEGAAYIIAAQDERVIFGPGDKVYVGAAEQARPFDLYHVVRRDRMLRDPETGENLGIALLPVAEAEIIQAGPVSTARLRNASREAIRGDLLIGFDEEPDLLFDISHPPEDIQGQVILLFDAISQIGTHQAVVVNRGERDGVRNGQVLAVWEAGRRAHDPTQPTYDGGVVELPQEEIGTMMVFRTFEKVAYALVVESIRPIREGYKVRHP